MDRPLTLRERLRLLPGKIASRGPSWLFSRLRRELRLPTTAGGRLLRTMAGRLADLAGELAHPLARWRRRDTLYAFYDLEVQPVTFDICHFLASAEIERKACGAHHVHAVFVPAFDGMLRDETADYDAVISLQSRLRRVYSILLPATALLPSCTGHSLASSRAQAAAIRAKARHVYPRGYTTAMPLAHAQPEWMEANRRGDVAVLAAQPHAVALVRERVQGLAAGRQVVTITLRQYAFMPDRNSNLDAWRSFARSLDPRRYLVIVLPDVETLSTAVDGFGEALTMPELAIDIGLRAALYETADLNLGINNGPMALCYLNRRTRYAVFKIITNCVPQACRDLFLQHGPQPGTQPAFVRAPDQIWVWEDDTPEAIGRVAMPMLKSPPVA